MPQLAQLNMCTGCTACSSVCPKGCISIIVREDGFQYPVINTDRCIECKLCERVCPVLNSQPTSHTPKAYAAYARNVQTRLSSSSGGIFSELSRLILSKGGAVYGAAYDESFRVIHTCAEDENDLASLRGAKYAQSNLDGVFPDIKKRLKQDQTVLFAGTPCQIAGLKAFLQSEYDNLITVDFICHGVSSPMVWEKFVSHMAASGSIRNINLRAKDTGWRHYRYSNRFEYEDGHVELITSGNSLFMKLFTSDYINRLSCETCRFKGYGRQSDLTLGDFWGIWDIDPEMDDDQGTSVVLVQSKTGQALWGKICDRIVFKEVTLDKASLQNRSILESSIAKPDRSAVLERISNGDIASCTDLFPSTKQSLKQIILQLIRRLLGRTA